MTKRIIVILTLGLLASAFMATAGLAKTGTAMDLADADRAARINSFNLQGPYEFVGRVPTTDEPRSVRTSRPTGRHAVGSAFSPNAGIGVGESIALTYDDMQYGFPLGRQVSHYWNGLTGVDLKVSVHFAYESAPDTLAGSPGDTKILSGYNIFDATIPPNGDWPRGQDAGCQLQGIDTLGEGKWVNLDIMNQGMADGRAVLAAKSSFFSDTLADGRRFFDNMFFFQGGEFSCTYTPALNTTFIDSTVYQAFHYNTEDGDLSDQPQVVTQWDGSNVITHVLLGEELGTVLTGTAYVDDGEALYRVFTYYRKVGDAAAGSWSSGVVIDSIMQVYATNGTTLSASTISGKVCISYSNPGKWGNQLNNPYDTDIYYRESINYGVTWAEKVDITNYENAVLNDPAHFKGWVEASSFYDSGDDLHIIWTGTPTSANPYFDNYNWNDFDTDVYHWARSTGDIVTVAKGTYLNDDRLSGSINTFHCGFGGQYAGYIAFLWMSECDDKLYTFWNQYHERANHGDWREDETLINDCALVGERLSMANWEVMVSVADITGSSCWDPPRSVSDTYTPDCGLPGDPDITGPCGSEYKPSMERFGLDETGMDLYWPPATLVDLTPAGDPAYAGYHFINGEYIDDMMPGPSGIIPTARAVNDVYSLNSEKWIRVACVEAVQASLIDLSPDNIEWPRWVEFGTIGSFPVTVINDGNIELSVSEIGFSEITGSSWLGTSITLPPAFTVDACVNNTNTFNVTVDATGISTTQWLEGIVWLKSDAANADSVAMRINILAAAAVEDCVWDTVQTDPDLFDPYGVPEGECLALAVGNNGEMGWALAGNVNLDFALSGNECGPRDRDAVYLASSTAWTLDADAAGANVMLSSSASETDQIAVHGFDPIGTIGSISGGMGVGQGPTTPAFDSVATGRFVNRDTTIAWERVVYAPRHDVAHNSFMIVLNKVYSADGLSHENIAFGSLTDWDVPAEEVPNNISAESVGGNFTYMQGTDTTTLLSCQSNTTRFATEAFGGWYVNADSCTQTETYYGAWAGYQMLMEDTNQMRDGTPLDPQQPDPQAWWDDIGANPNNNGYATEEDQAIWLTVMYDYDLAAADTVFFWTVMSTVRNATLVDLENQIAYAKTWYVDEVLGCTDAPPTCCIGTVGNVNGDPNEEVTIGDIAVLVNHLFIEKPLLDCVLEADINQSGGENPSQINPGSDITIGDVAIMTDYLFITTPAIYGPLLTCF